jgi:hypothetical protein
VSDSRRIPLATLASPENSKLGPWIHSWSLPAGKRETCPGETDLCRRACYAKKNSFAYPSVQTAYRRNKAMADKPWFADCMTAELKHRMVRIVRIHVSGDFYSVEYTRKWHTIVAACPDARFFAYTRSWAVDAMLYDLIQLSRFPNMALWWSVDRLSGPADFTVAEVPLRVLSQGKDRARDPWARYLGLKQRLPASFPRDTRGPR